MRRIKIGIVGCGAIGGEIARACKGFLKGSFQLKAIYDIDREKSEVESLDELFDLVDLVVESASASISRKVLEKAIEKKKSVLIMSVGGLIDSGALLEKARRKNINVYLPSGAICGIDGVKAARLSKIKKITLTTKKPPKGLEGAPFLKVKNIDLKAIKGERVLFEGNALEAVKGFPKNVNVSSILSLAGLGARKTTVRIITSPKYTKNVHEIKVTGDFGAISTKTENVPSKNNPKTSRLAYLSAIAMLKAIAEGVKIGT